MRASRDRGAAAVEFALVLPVLMALTLGTIAFGHALHVQTVIDAAARDAVRVAALSTQANRVVLARQTAVQSASPNVQLLTSQVAVFPAVHCTAGSTVRVEVRVHHALLGGVGAIDLIGQASMRCGG